MARLGLPPSSQMNYEHMNGNPFPVRSCVPASTADHYETPVDDWSLPASASTQWADELLTDVPAYLILGHLARLRGAVWNQAGVLDVRRAK